MTPRVHLLPLDRDGIARAQRTGGGGARVPASPPPILNRVLRDACSDALHTLTNEVDAGTKFDEPGWVAGSVDLLRKALFHPDPTPAPPPSPQARDNTAALPCPFCGTLPVLKDDGDEANRTYWVQCATCTDRPLGAVIMGGNTEGEAFAEWNRRAVPASLTPRGPDRVPQGLDPLSTLVRIACRLADAAPWRQWGTLKTAVKRYREAAAFDWLRGQNAELERFADSAGAPATPAPQAAALDAEALREMVGLYLNGLRDRFRAAGISRGWSFDWPERSGYAHGESAELVEAVRGKRGDVVDEAGDVLLTCLLGLVPPAVSLIDCVAAAERKVKRIASRDCGVDGRHAPERLGTATGDSE